MVADCRISPVATSSLCFSRECWLPTSLGTVSYWATGFNPSAVVQDGCIVVLHAGCGSTTLLAHYLSHAHAVVSMVGCQGRGLSLDAIDQVLARVRADTGCDPRPLTLVASGTAVVSAVGYARKRGLCVRRLVLLPQSGCDFAAGGAMDGLLPGPVSVLLPSREWGSGLSDRQRAELETRRRLWCQVDQWRGRLLRQAFRCSRVWRCDLIGYDLPQSGDPTRVIADLVGTCLKMPEQLPASPHDLKFSL